MIYTKDRVRDHVARELLSLPEEGEDAAIERTRSELCLPREAVLEALEPAEVA